MPLWCDKYRPNDLDKLDLHPQVNRQLRQLVQAGDFPHLMLFGPSGAGKRTRVYAVLRKLFGNGVEKTRVAFKSFRVKTRNIDITTRSSNYHIELTPSDCGIHDRLVVQEVIKEMAMNSVVNASSQGVSFRGPAFYEILYHIILTSSCKCSGGYQRG